MRLREKVEASTNGRGRPASLAIIPPARRRRLSLAVLAVLMAVGSALVFAVLWMNAGDRRPVLAVVAPVAAGQAIEDADLGVVRVSVDPLLDPLPADARSEIVGQVAAVDVAAGTLLTAVQLGGDDALQPGQALVGLALRGGQVPTTAQPGDRVEVIQTAPAGASADGSPDGLGQVLAAGEVFAIESTGDAAGGVLVSLRVAEQDAPSVAGAAAADRVSLVLVADR